MNKNLKTYMNKRGEFILIGALIIIVLTGVGLYFVYNNTDNLFIGNKETGEYLNYFKCEDIAKQIPEDKVILFKSKEEAEQKYTAIEGCV